MVEAWTTERPHRVSERFFVKGGWVQNVLASDDGSVLVVESASGIDVLRAPELVSRPTAASSPRRTDPSFPVAKFVSLAHLEGRFAALSSDGHVLVVTDDTESHWYEISEAKVQKTHVGQRYRSAFFSRDGKRALLADEELLQVFDVRSNALVASIPTKEYALRDFQPGPEPLSPNGRTIVMLKADMIVRIDLHDATLAEAPAPRSGLLKSLRGRMPDKLLPEPMDEPQLVLESDLIGTVHGVVTRGGKPAPGVSVDLIERTYSQKPTFHAISNERGEFRFERVPARLYTVFAKDDLSFLGASTSVDLDPLRRQAEVSLALLPRSGVAGVVRDPQGLPMSNVELTFFVRQQKVGTKVTDQSGRYAFDAAPEANVNVVYRSEAGVSGAVFLPPLPAHTVQQDIRLVAADSPSACRLRVATKNGRPLADVPVRVDSSNGRSFDTATNAEGVLVVAADPCSFTVASHDQTEVTRAPHPHEHQVILPAGVLELQGRADLSISFAEVPGTPEEVFARRCVNDKKAERRVYHCLPAGNYKIEYQSDDGRYATVDLALNDDERRVVPVPELGPGWMLEGVVLDQTTGQAIVHAHVETDGLSPVRRSIHTGARGTFRMTGLAAKVFDLTVKAYDASRRISLDLRNGPPSALRIELTPGVTIDNYRALPFELEEQNGTLRITKVAPHRLAFLNFQVGDTIHAINGIAAPHLTRATAYNSLRDTPESRIRFIRAGVDREVTIPSGLCPHTEADLAAWQAKQAKPRNTDELLKLFQQVDAHALEMRALGCSVRL